MSFLECVSFLCLCLSVCELCENRVFHLEAIYLETQQPSEE